MRPALALLALIALGCGNKTEAPEPKPLTKVEDVTGVVQPGMELSKVEQALGAPKQKMDLAAPGIDGYWVYDVPTDAPKDRVQVFHHDEKVVELKVIPFDDAASAPRGP